MALMELKLETLRDLDLGKVDVAFSQELRKAVKDCMDRPGDSGARKVNLQLSLKPLQADDGTCETVTVEFRVKCSTPVLRTRSYSASPNTRGGLLVNSTSADDVRQGTLPAVDDFYDAELKKRRENDEHA